MIKNKLFFTTPRTALSSSISTRPGTTAQTN